jgi:hypothetical protein
MKRMILVAAAIFVAAAFSWSQSPVSPDPGDGKPASTNAPGREYPRVDSQGRATFRILAPDAKTIRVLNTNLTKGPDGYWTGATQPLDPGFHYYTITIDGVNVADPNSQGFFGAGSVRSGIEIPDRGVDFYDMKDVPHGEIRSRWSAERLSDGTTSPLLHGRECSLFKRAVGYTPTVEPGFAVTH